uniref:Uncharacterized protein n=1 Tax=Anguilla anguilla TaxID=7936 RepID=A0A0E9RVV6_ANGAN
MRNNCDFGKYYNIISCNAAIEHSIRQWFTNLVLGPPCMLVFIPTTIIIL